MKKLLYISFCFALVAILVNLIPAMTIQAFNLSRWTTYGDRFDMVVQEQTEEDGMVVMTFASASAATTSVMIDKSDIRNFPHIANAPIHITKITVDWDAENGSVGPNASTTVKFGVVASSTATATAGKVANVNYFDMVSFDSDLQGTAQRAVLDYFPSMIKLDINSGTTTGILTNNRDINGAAWALPQRTPRTSASGGEVYAYPNLGDLVVNIYKQNGIATTTVKVFYHVKY